ncbi:uncharacterized protein B0I36DRAFT_47166 [Microdochium trichocladiopsis]|uniref:Uncharacterized protein n=1 Tax=Microdochium trichocladiopsis TaxID=1682393 RepID=A0A9P9BJY9_9PEZI|nr:uncharacterized protein B0I36DRAFT_47166 [Microdochium trichocladiopsis]KAH7016524.1 hypothetical protein B0I36DRAFT_47166 [Microdochium trichocladiopsis]
MLCSWQGMDGAMPMQFSRRWMLQKWKAPGRATLIIESRNCDTVDTLIRVFWCSLPLIVPPSPLLVVSALASAAPAPAPQADSIDQATAAAVSAAIAAVTNAPARSATAVATGTSDTTVSVAGVVSVSSDLGLDDILAQALGVSNRPKNRQCWSLGLDINSEYEKRTPDGRVRKVIRFTTCCCCCRQEAHADSVSKQLPRTIEQT